MKKTLLFVGNPGSDLARLAGDLGYRVRHAAYASFLNGRPADRADGIVVLAQAFPQPTLLPHYVLNAIRGRMEAGVRAFAEQVILFNRPDGVRCTLLDNQRLVARSSPLTRGLEPGILLDPHQTYLISAPLPSQGPVVTNFGEGMERADESEFRAEACLDVGVAVGTHTLLAAEPATLSPAIGLVQEGRRHWCVSRLRLSQFQSDLYAPGNAWQTLAENVLRHVAGDEGVTFDAPETTDRVILPRRGRAPLTAWSGEPAGAPSSAAVQRAALALERWFRRSGMLPHPDGSQGVAERFMTEVYPGGIQPLDYSVRTDCTMHTVLFYDRLNRLTLSPDKALPSRLVDFLVRNRYQDDDATRATYGFWQWGRGKVGRTNESFEWPEDVYANDQAWVLLALANVAPLAVPGLDERLERTARALLETQGSDGLRARCLRGSDLNARGRAVVAAQPGATPCGHFDGIALAALLSYGLRFQKRDFVDAAARGLEALAAAMLEDHRIDVPLSLTSDSAFCLPALSLGLIHLKSDLCRRALEKLTAFLMACQHPSGALVEHGNPVEDLSRRSGDVGVFTGDDDLIVDLLYTMPPAALYLPLAAQALNSADVKRAADRLLHFLVTVQIRSPRKELNGAYKRAFSLREWDAYGYNADFKWGPTVIESGWTNAVIGAAFCQYLLGTPFLGDL